MGIFYYFNSSSSNMVKGVGVASMQKNVKQFWVVGRELPSEATPEPTCFRIRVFAKNVVLARSHFWYEMKRQNKVRKCQGEIVSVSEIFEKKTGAIKNFGIVLKYSTRTDVVNMYKEMAGRHSARGDSIHIIKTVIQPNSSVLRE